MPAPSPSKMTRSQTKSLEAMRSCLRCQLCNNNIDEPATLLACAHSFCHFCILKYTENSWQCPLPGCKTPVTMKGGGKEYIKRNPQISAVVSSLEKIEHIIGSGPGYWWVGRDDGQAGAVKFEEEEEVVDFQMIMERDSKKRRLEKSASCDDGDDVNSIDDGVSSTTKKNGIGEIRDNCKQYQTGGRKTMSFDQSLFTSDTSVNSNQKNMSPPCFSCSPIAMQSSQIEPSLPISPLDDGVDAVHAATVTSLVTSDQHPNDLETLLHVARREDSSFRTKQRATLSTPNGQIVRSNRVSFQQQPRVMLLYPPWTLSTKHTRSLRKCLNDGLISMLKICTNDAFLFADEFDSGFDFDTDEGRESFLAMLSCNRTDNCPPAPLSFYAISAERDLNFSFGEAIIVPRCFNYYLAVACGLAVVDIEFLSSAENSKRGGRLNHRCYLFPDSAKEGEKKCQKNYHVLGASNYTWDAPKKARNAALDRHFLWQRREGCHANSETLLPGNGLLQGFSVLLGEFDQPNQKKRAVSKRKKYRDSDVKGGGYCTRGNICLLLQICGAHVYDIDSITSLKQIKKGLTKNELNTIKSAIPLPPSENESALNDALLSNGKEFHGRIILVTQNAKRGADLLKHLLSAILPGEKYRAQIPVVSSQWLLDSIGEFEVQETSKYG